MTLTRTGGDCVGNESSRSGALFFANGARREGNCKSVFFCSKTLCGKKKEKKNSDI